MNRPVTAPGSMLPWMMFWGAGAAIFVLFLFQLLYVSQPDFRVAHHVSGAILGVQWSTALLGIAFAFLWLGARNLNVASPRYFLCGVIVLCAGVVLVALLTHPTRAQDIYHDLLLAKAFSQEGLNPYHTTPHDVSADPWAYPVYAWKNVPMVYGPLWTLLLSATAQLTHSLGAALILVKMLIVGILIGAGVLFWKLTGLKGYPPGRRIVSLALLGLNPLLIQTAIVDAHSDALVLAATLASYYFFYKKRYGASGFMLFLGGLIKYVPWLILPLPLFYFLKEERPWRGKLIELFGWASVSATLLFLSYAPFGGIAFKNAEGLQFYFTNVGIESAGLPTAVLIAKAFSLTTIQLALMGAVLSMLVLGFCIFTKRPLLGYTLPYLVYFAFGTLWFQSWYVLWILPLLYFLAPGVSFMLISGLSFIIYEVMPTFPLGVLVGSGFAMFFSWNYLNRQLMRMW